MADVFVRGDYSKTFAWFNKMQRRSYLSALDSAGKRGVDALSSATPTKTGKTAASWSYQINRRKDTTEIVWTNTNSNGGVNIAVILQYGHGTGTGGYVQGIDYINPALRPIFDQIEQDVMKAVRS